MAGFGPDLDTQPRGMCLALDIRRFGRRVSGCPRVGLTGGSADMAASAGYLPVIGAASFVLWYRPIYLGFSRTEGKAMAFFFCKRCHLPRFDAPLTAADLYFLFAGFHLLFSIYMAIGIPCELL